MFTGIIERLGTLRGVSPSEGGARLRVEVGDIAGEVALGDSICVNGVCLTACAVGRDTVDFDAITETLQQTRLGDLRVGDRVNLERALRAGGRLDGHFVQGHVDGMATVSRVIATPREHVIWMSVAESLLPYLVWKGSVAVDGVSLTIAGREADRFSVALIPTTLQETTLQYARAGDRLHIETDVIARTVVHWLEQLGGGGSAGLSLESLRRAGFA